MANPFIQYLQDTKGELRHVAWPTRTQTIVYTVLVAALSVGVALYLSVMDLFFTGGLKQAFEILPQSTIGEVANTSESPITITEETGATDTVPVAPAVTPETLPTL